MKIGDIVKYKINDNIKTGIIYGIGSDVFIGKDSVPKQDVLEKIKSLEVGDVMLIKANSHAPTMPVVLCSIFIEKHGGEEYHHYTWAYLEEGQLQEADCFPLDLIQVPHNIYNILEAIQTPKGSRAGVPSNKDVYDFNNKISEQSLDEGVLVAFCRKDIVDDREQTICDIRVATSNRISKSAVDGFFCILSDDDVRCGTYDSLIFPLNRTLQYGDIISTPEVDRGIFLSQRGNKIFIYNTHNNEIEQHLMKDLTITNINSNERAVMDKLMQLVKKEIYLNNRKDNI